VCRAKQQARVRWVGIELEESIDHGPNHRCQLVAPLSIRRDSPCASSLPSLPSAHSDRLACTRFLISITFPQSRRASNSNRASGLHCYPRPHETPYPWSSTVKFANSTPRIQHRRKEGGLQLEVLLGCSVRQPLFRFVIVLIFHSRSVSSSSSLLFLSLQYTSFSGAHQSCASMLCWHNNNFRATLVAWYQFKWTSMPPRCHIFCTLCVTTLTYVI
jgi:hypothetical protein